MAARRARAIARSAPFPGRARRRVHRSARHFATHQRVRAHPRSACLARVLEPGRLRAGAAAAPSAGGVRRRKQSQCASRAGDGCTRRCDCAHRNRYSARRDAARSRRRRSFAPAANPAALRNAVRAQAWCNNRAPCSSTPRAPSATRIRCETPTAWCARISRRCASAIALLPSLATAIAARAAGVSPHDLAFDGGTQSRDRR